MGAAVVELVQERTAPSAKPQPQPMALNGAVLAAVLGFAAVGTGGVANANVISPQISTGPVVYAHSVNLREREQERLVDTQEKLAGIRHYLSFNITDLAAVLNVGRPTVYSWFADSVVLQTKHRERVDAIYRLARDWRTVSSIPIGQLINEPLPNGTTLLQLLAAERLDAAEIRTAMLRIKELRDRTEKRVSVVESAKRAGVKLASKPRRNWRSPGNPRV